MLTLTPARRAVVAVATVLALILGVGGIAWAASRTTATCNPSPATTTGADGVSFAVRCTVPVPPSVTVTRTVTATPTSPSSPTTSSSTPTVTSTPTLPPTSTATATVPPTTQPPTTAPSTGFPNANTTGPRVATSPGSGNVCGTVSGRLITGDLILGCDSTVTDSRIMGRVVSNGYRLTGSYLEIGPDSCPARGGDFQLIRDVFTLDHTHFRNAPGQDPIALVPGTSTLRDSLIDSSCFYAGDHLDAAQAYAPGAKIVATLDHNTISSISVNGGGEKGNAAVFLANDPGRGTTIVVTNNLLSGGNYTVSAYDAKAGSGIFYDVRGNTFVRGSWNYGPCASTYSVPYDGTSGLRFTGNAYDDGTALSSC